MSSMRILVDPVVTSRVVITKLSFFMHASLWLAFLPEIGRYLRTHLRVESVREKHSLRFVRRRRVDNDKEAMLPS